jgi:hypothetical protein
MSNQAFIETVEVKRTWKNEEPRIEVRLYDDFGFAKTIIHKDEKLNINNELEILEYCIAHEDMLGQNAIEILDSLVANQVGVYVNMVGFFWEDIEHLFGELKELT